MVEKRWKKKAVHEGQVLQRRLPNLLYGDNAIRTRMDTRLFRPESEYSTVSSETGAMIHKMK
jgi:hypothetical protein